MLDIYDAKALAFGNGTILSNTTTITKDVHPPILPRNYLCLT